MEGNNPNPDQNQDHQNPAVEQHDEDWDFCEEDEESGEASVQEEEEKIPED